MEQIKKKVVYLSFERSILQVFYAILAYVEKYNKEVAFLIDDKNIELITECERYFNFVKIELKNYEYDYDTIKVLVDHSQPLTKLTACYSNALIFPRVINAKHNTSFNSKEDKIYFRGLLTKSRLVEVLFLFLSIKDFRGVIILLIKLMRNNRNFEVNTSKVFINFTKRGRLSEFKFLDEDYFAEMTNYKFVFCPKGDFIWTYRFFEAIQVGSIPISKHVTQDYTSFFYLKEPNKLNVEYSDLVAKNLDTFNNKFYL